MSTESSNRRPGRPALGKQRVQLTLRPDVDALLNELSGDMHADRSSIVNEAVFKYAEGFYTRLWNRLDQQKKWQRHDQVDAVYFRFSRTITSNTQTGPDPITAPLHLLIKVEKTGNTGTGLAEDARTRAIRLLEPFWGDIVPNPGLLIEITEAQARKSHVLQPLSSCTGGTVYNVEWP
jgi:hypothetical protein